MRTRALLLLSLSAAPLSAQQLTRADSNLVYAILTAEDRRDSLAPALAEGMRHADARIRTIATRAQGRITDSLFTARSALPALAPRITWPLPAWRYRYDSLRARRNDCTAMAAALADPVLQVRLRAIDLLPSFCADSGGITSALAGAIDTFPDRRSPDLPLPAGWYAAAHSAVALARLAPALARARVDRLSRHRVWQVRMYAARAAQLTGDTALLRRMTRDGDGNVAEAALEGLSALGGHAHDAAFVQALRSTKPQVVRAAAVALKGSPRTDVRLAASAVFGRWRSRRVDSERDARLALLELMGRPASEDVRRPIAPLPREVVALALGKTVDLYVGLGPATRDSFVVRLRGDVAPITAARVLALVDRGYYYGTTWHRVIPDFVIQGGGHGASEYVGGDRFFRDELGPLSHLRGGVGMSTRGHDTGDGQWFIDLSDLPRLDRDYTLFGEVIAGMDAVDAILEGTPLTVIRLPRIIRR